MYMRSIRDIKFGPDDEPAPTIASLCEVYPNLKSARVMIHSGTPFGPRLYEYTWSTDGLATTVECRAFLEGRFQYDDLESLASQARATVPSSWAWGDKGIIVEGVCISNPRQVGRLHRQAKSHDLNIGPVEIFIRDNECSAAVEALTKVAGEPMFQYMSILPLGNHTMDGDEETATYTAFVQACSSMDFAVMSRSALDLRGARPWRPIRFLLDSRLELRRWGKLELYWHWDQLINDLTVANTKEASNLPWIDESDRPHDNHVQIHLRVEQAINDDFDSQLLGIDQNADQWIPRLATVLHSVFGSSATCSVSVHCDDILLLMSVGDIDARCAAATGGLQRRFEAAWAGVTGLVSNDDAGPADGALGASLMGTKYFMGG